jgi:hypothetical protein
MKNRKLLKGVLIIFVSLLITATVALSMSSANYGINWDVISAGGSSGGTRSSTHYKMAVDTIGGGVIGKSSSTHYSLSSGFAVFSPAVSPSSFTLHIPSGWALISVPFDTNASLLSCQFVLYWDGTMWQNATTLNPGVGYLVLNSGNTKDVTTTGTPSSSPFTKSATGSWQLIGNPFTSPCTLASTSTIQIILYWDGSMWQNANVNNLQPGVGYLVLTSSPGTFTFTTKP